MKRIYLVGALALTVVACQREEEAASKASEDGAPGRARHHADSAPAAKTSKASNRSQSKKPIPMAEAVPDKPGFVKSPNSGNIVDVTGLSAGTVVTDPGFPAEDPKYFKVPVMEQLAQNTGTQKVAEPAAAPIPNKPGFVINPYTNTEFDASDIEPGSMVLDPSSLPGPPRFFQVPDEQDPSDE